METIMNTEENKQAQNPGAQSERRIYVACLASYNNGTLHGAWIDAEQDSDDIAAEVAAMLRESKYPNVHVDCPDCDEESRAGCETCKGAGKVPSAEEWAIHDFEGFGPVKLSESESFETVAALAKAIEEHGEIFAHYYDNQSSSFKSGDIDSVVSDFEEKNRGEWDTLADYVENYWDECGEFKADSKNWWHPTNYIDWERMAKDLETSGDIFTIELDGKVHVFDNH